MTALAIRRALVDRRVRRDLGHRVGTIVAVDAERLVDEKRPYADRHDSDCCHEQQQADDVFRHESRTPSRSAAKPWRTIADLANPRLIEINARRFSLLLGRGPEVGDEARGGRPHAMAAADRAIIALPKTGAAT